MSRNQSLERKVLLLSRKNEKNQFAKICSSLTLIILKVNSVALPTSTLTSTEVNDSHRIRSNRKSVDLVFVVVLLEL